MQVEDDRGASGSSPGVEAAPETIAAANLLKFIIPSLLGVGLFAQQAWLLSIVHYLYPIPWFVVMFMAGTWFWKTEQTY